MLKEMGLSAVHGAELVKTPVSRAMGRDCPTPVVNYISSRLFSNETAIETLVL